jgi:hypothetical protein
MRRPAAFRVLLSLLVFEGISATPPGLLLILDPKGGLMRMPLTMLRGSPFHDFMIPGLILFAVLGLGAFLVAASLLALRHGAWTAALVFSFALMTWIAVQVVMIGLGSWLQPLYLGVGLAIAVLLFAPSVRRYLAAN